MTDQTTTPAFDAQLKPCPFCDNAPFHHETDEMVGNDGGLEVICLTKDCVIAGLGIDMNEWNNRANKTIPASDIRPLVEALQSGMRVIKDWQHDEYGPQENWPARRPYETMQHALSAFQSKYGDAK